MGLNFKQLNKDCRTSRAAFLKSLCLLFIIFFIPANPGFANAAQCNLALVLALDASSSVDRNEYRLQQEGLAQALSDPEVKSTILTLGGVYLAAFEWSGRYQQTIISDWLLLSNEGTIDIFVQRTLEFERRHEEFPTAIGYALGFASRFLKNAPNHCRRKVIDIAGDGVHNDGFSAASAYENFEFSGVTVNGLVIKGSKPDPEKYYKTRVIRGPGAFVEITHGYSDYAQAMKRKLLREVSGSTVAMQPSLSNRNIESRQ